MGIRGLIAFSLLLASPVAAQDVSGDAGDDSSTTEQPMGGIGVTGEFARKHVPDSWSEPVVVLELFLDPESRVIDCSVRYPERSLEDEELLCRKPLGKRTGFPATGPDGEHAYGLGRVRITGGSRNSTSIPADLEIVVSGLPEGRSRYDTVVLAHIDEAGKVDACQRVGSNPQFALIACQQAVGHTFPLRRGQDGEAVPYVANVSVAFLTGDAAP